MSKILLPISNGFEEIEAVTVIDVCRRADIEVTVCALENLETTGANNIKIVADTKIENQEHTSFDMIVLPGGLPNAFTLAKSEHLKKLLNDFKQNNKYIAAICAAPYALDGAGVLNQNYTCYPSFEQKIRLDGYSSDKSVVMDGNVLTSRGPGTAMDFALEIVKLLKGNETYEELRKGLLLI